MVSESELVSRLREFLSTSDLNTTTTANVRRQLEQDFGIDLRDKKAFIREQVDLYLETQQQNEEDNKGNDEEEQAEGEEEEEDEDEDEEASNGKSGGSRKKRLAVNFCYPIILLSLSISLSCYALPSEESMYTHSGRQIWSKKENTEVKKKGGGFTKLCTLSPQLQKLTGVPELARTEVVKQLWSYIREHDLQDPSNRRNIRCDGPFRELFGVETIDMFQMNKELAKHIWPLNSDAPAPSAPKPKKQKKEREEDSRKEKKQKVGGGSSGFLAPITLSEALVKFLGTGENALPRSDVVKRIWDYIKKNNLQDPSDKRRILCDEKLKELFDVDTFNGFSVSKLLTAHFIKGER
ncbi:hypothetical protein L2E82_44020 [Cichorium intybus]|uniref:Uncharacterized protein n=1 Tax=Cichorium intybus TaxID=13427 RepID=A0ACB8ZPM5_CICIN|nr:hypothetical protein L2E82_44020 [Cichorium intybus]